MKAKFISGKVLSVRSIETVTKVGKHAGEVVNRLIVTIDCVGTKEETATTMCDDCSTISFMLADGDSGYNDFLAMEGSSEQYAVKIRASRVTCSNDFINVQIEKVCVYGDDEEIEYIMPEIGMVEPKAKRRSVD